MAQLRGQKNRWHFIPCQAQKMVMIIQTGQLRSASPLYVVYIPYATEQNTGIATKTYQRGSTVADGTPVNRGRIS